MQKKKKKVLKKSVCLLFNLIIILIVLVITTKEVYFSNVDNRIIISKELIKKNKYEELSNNNTSKESDNISIETNNNKNELENKLDKKDENNTENESSKNNLDNDNDNSNQEQTSSSNENNNKLVYEKINVEGNKEVVGESNNGHKIYKINNLYYVDDYLIVNKTYSLPSDFIPSNTVLDAQNKTNTCNKCIDKTVYKAWLDMEAAASAIGLNIYISSGYRPYSTQEKLYNNYVNRDGKSKADTYSARAGHSEHQSGLAFDLNQINDTFANTNEGKWIASHAYIYGFILRYPKGKSEQTGYKYESWHLRYVGTDLSYKLYNDGNWITMEEYFGITSTYQD